MRSSATSASSSSSRRQSFGYVILALVLKPKPPALYVSPDEESFWRGVGTAPADTLHFLKRIFIDLEMRLGQMESQVASGDFDLHRKFRDLGR